MNENLSLLFNLTIFGKEIILLIQTSNTFDGSIESNSLKTLEVDAAPRFMT